MGRFRLRGRRRRNRAKRLMREAFRLLVKEGALPEKTEWVFVGRAALGGKRCADVMREIRWLAERSSTISTERRSTNSTGKGKGAN